MNMRRNKFLLWLSTFIICYALWLLLVWSLSMRELLLGALVAAVAAWFSGRFFVHENPAHMFSPVRIASMAVYCLGVFMWELIKANVSMAKLVLSPKMKFNAGIIRVPGSEKIKSMYGLAMVANSITLTPGTITLDITEDENGRNYYYIHWIDVTETDREKAGEIIKGTMEKWIGRIWK